MTTIQINKGFDIKMKGKPERRLIDAAEPVVVSVDPPEFEYIKPKLMVAKGDEVLTGQALFRDKNTPGLQIASPATGRVTDIVLGKRRRPLCIQIVPAAAERFAEVARVDPERLGSYSREELIMALKQCGLWPLIRQRPVGKMADGERTPSAIYVNGMDSEPLAADPAFAVAGLGHELQLGIDLLARLVEGPVYLTMRAGAPASAEFSGLGGVERHEFGGPHPCGLVGTHIARIAPLGVDQVVWFLKAQEVVLLGQWLASGYYPTHRVVALSGSGAPQPAYYRVRQGASLTTLTGGEPLEDHLRPINGTVLTGRATRADGFLGYFACTVTVIPEGGARRDLFGWMLPQLGRHSASHSVWGWLRPRPEYDLDARLNGSPRAIVNIGAWERMTPLDIHPTRLVRAIQAGDLEEALELGLLEVTEEDVALCTFADPCKIDLGTIIREGLDLYEKES